MSSQSTAAEPLTAAQENERDEFADHVVQATSHALEVFSIYLGLRLGYYTALRDGPLTVSALAERSGTARRYAREWLEQQASAGILHVDNPLATPEMRRFALPAAQAEVLADTESLNYLAPLAQLVAGVVHPLPTILAAYRSGGGVPFAAYGADLREGQASINRTMFLRQLGPEWLPQLPDVHARLLAQPPAHVADIGSGAGWSSIGMARSYPSIRVDGFDLDEESVQLARLNAAGAGVSHRARFSTRDAGEITLAGQYDLVTAFECLHDMAQPVAVLQVMRQLAGPTGAVLVMDEKVGDTFLGPDSSLDSLMYGWSILHCLPVGKAEEPSAETGTVMRTATFMRYAQDAGFSRVEVTPIQHPFFRFYRLYS
ncbi:class I SAM-dependent methyltransferase [Hymenobacter sediminicola]|uniref:Class I SAM-dependent methyltransferase n=1 Tax=Hymenobacter sediminicola TaxID=2761579 RepID=A0A7G7WAQ1_9BACT|nr:class I SAM-dependent methyltransferase [Hymenobacter sediminicola]QNH63444.1 class I SAM-dependent methyltransferase [Hymenobacter sediminicola]